MTLMLYILNGFEIYDTMIAIFKCLEPKASEIHLSNFQTNAKMIN